MPLSAALLALGTALAAACFVRAFGMAFLALPRSAHAEQTHEVCSSMRWAMGLLVLVCVGLGILSPLVISGLNHLLASLVATTSENTVSGAILTGPIVLELASGHYLANLSPPGIAMILLLLVPLSVGIASLAGALRLRRAMTWSCGLPQLHSRMEYTATGFSKPIRLIFSRIYRPRKEVEIETDISSYVSKRIRYELHIESPFETYFYQPLSAAVLSIANLVRRIQTGSLNTYLAYIFIALVILLLLAR